LIHPPSSTIGAALGAPDQGRPVDTEAVEAELRKQRELKQKVEEIQKYFMGAMGGAGR